MKSYRIVGLTFLAAIVMGFSWRTEVKSPKIDQQKLLDRHNYYRDQVGVPHLKWSDELAEVAQTWANNLSKSCDMYHSKSEYGENIYWTSGSADENQVVDSWGSEKKRYNHKNRVFKRSSGMKTGHYSQIIWRNTTHVGGAMQKCKHGGEMWVCNYDPAGNYIGEKAY